MSEFKFLQSSSERFVDQLFKRSGLRPVKTFAQLLDVVSSQRDYDSRWRKYSIYLSTQHNLIIQREDITVHQNEDDRDYLYIFKTVAELRSFFDCQDEDPAYEDGIKRIGRAEQSLMHALTTLGVDLAEEVE